MAGGGVQRCSGIHRGLGTHLSKVRSTTLDVWLPDQVAFMQYTGNAVANAHFERVLPPAFHRPSHAVCALLAPLGSCWGWPRTLGSGHLTLDQRRA